MSYRLKINLDPVVKSQVDRNKRIWNFVKKDIAVLLDTVDAESNFTINTTPAHGFMIDYKPTGQSLDIGADLAFSDGLELCLTDPAFLSFLLAIVIRLNKTYVGAFSVFCDSYSIVDGAIKLLKKALKLQVTRNYLSAFIAYPTPGRKPVKEKPLTSAEIRREVIRKKRASGMSSVSAWLHEPVKASLDEFCKTQGFTLDEALNKIIPIGIKTTCSVLGEFEKSP